MESTINLTEQINEDSDKQLDFKQLSLPQKILYLKRIITVEPLVCCYILPLLIASLAVQTLQLQMACRVNLHLNDTICSDLLSANNTEYEKRVEIAVTEMLPWKTALSTTIPSILVLFFGSYSDRHKRRKPFLISPIVGEFFATVVLIFCVINISAWPMQVAGLAETFFPALTGSVTTMMMGVYSFVAEDSSTESRTLRVGMVHIISAAVSPIGYSLSGIVFTTLGYFGIFTISLTLYVIGICYAVFFIKEPGFQPATAVNKNICADLFDPTHIKDIFTTVFKTRRGSDRLRIILLMATFIVILGPNYGEAVISIYFTRSQFQWDEVHYSFYIAYDIIIHLIGSIVGVTVLSRWLKVHDLLLAIIACSSKVLASFLYAFSKTPTLFYIAPLVSILSSTGVIAMRSIATKLVTQDELGKIQSLFGICEAIAPIIYTVIYSKVYIATIDILPGAFYLMGAAMISPAICILFAMYLLEIRNNKKEEPIKTIESFKYTV